MAETPDSVQREFDAIDALENLIEYVKRDISAPWFRDRLSLVQEELHSYRDEVRDEATVARLKNL